jgi:hypothetical protein
MPRHVCLVGTAGSRAGAPVQDPNVEIWGVSSRGKLPRADRWFELHPIDVTFEKPGEANGWRAELKKFTTDIAELWMLFPEYGLHRNVIAYPIEKIKTRFGTEHMASTFSWMMAIAIDEMCPIDPDGTRHFAEPGSIISIYGVDMLHGSEYEEQRKGFQAMITVAKQLGIDVRRVLSGGLIYEPVPYPLWQLDPLIAKLDLRIKESSAALTTLDQSIIATREMICSTQGQLSEVQLMIAGDGVAEMLKDEDGPSKPYDPQERVKFLNQQLDHLKKTSAQISADIVGHSAVNGEQRYMRSYLMG